MQLLTLLLAWIIFQLATAGAGKSHGREHN